MAIAPKIKHVDQRPNGVLRFRRRFPKDVAEHLGQQVAEGAADREHVVRDLGQRGRDGALQ